MRLAIVRQRYTPFGGAERFVDLAIHALHDQGADISLICRRWNDDTTLPVVHCNPLYMGRLWRDWSFALGVQGIIQRNEFDLIQSHERIPGCHVFRAGDGIHATWLEQRARWRRGKTAFLDQLSPWHRYTLAAERQMFVHSNLCAVICNSQMVANDIRTRFNVANDKLHVVLNAVDSDRFSPALRSHRASIRQQLGLHNNTPTFVFVGSGFERKGLPILLKGLARTSRTPNVAAHLLVIGHDRHMSRHQQLAASLGLAERVHFLGPQKDVRPYLGAADAFAQPTLYDPMPNATLEALASGLPVLTSTFSGAAELISSPLVGQVVDPFNETTLVAALNTLILGRANPAHTQAARTSVAHLTPQYMAAALQKLYASLCSNTQ